MATKFCEQCRREHPGRECDYNPATGECAETREIPAPNPVPQTSNRLEPNQKRNLSS